MPHELTYVRGQDIPEAVVIRFHAIVGRETWKRKYRAIPRAGVTSGRAWLWRRAKKGDRQTRVFELRG